MTHGDQSWSSATFINQREAIPLTRRDQRGHLHLFIEDSMSIDRDYFSLHPAIQRQASPMVCRDDDGRPFLIVLSWDLLQFLLLSRDNQIRWHVETNIVVCFPRWKTQRLSIKTIEVYPAIPRQASLIPCGDVTASSIELLIGRVGI